MRKAFRTAIAFVVVLLVVGLLAYESLQFGFGVGMSACPVQQYR